MPTLLRKCIGADIIGYGFPDNLEMIICSNTSTTLVFKLEPSEKIKIWLAGFTKEVEITQKGATILINSNHENIFNMLYRKGRHGSRATKAEHVPASPSL